MISAVNTAMPTLTPACAKWIAAMTHLRIDQRLGTETLPIASTSATFLVHHRGRPASLGVLGLARASAGRSVIPELTTRQCP